MNARRPTIMAKRELENLLQVREKLSMRIIQEEVEVALPQTENCPDH